MKKFQVLILLCSIIFSTLLFADKDNDHHKKYKKDHIYKNLDFLDLNKKQYSQIREVLIQYKKEYRKFYHFKEKQEEKLEALVKSETFDKILYIRILENIKNIATHIEATNIEKIHSILNATQRERFSHYLEEWEVE